MDAISHHIINTQCNEADLKQLNLSLKDKEDMISNNLSQLDDVMATLDPAAHTLGMVYML